MTNPRAAMRRRLLVIGVVPALVALLFAGKVWLMLAHNDDGSAAYADGDFAIARGEYAANDSLNVLEGWVAPYNDGVARYRLKDYPGAIGRFEQALGSVPGDQECRVRVNLALVHEAVGDSAAEDADRDSAISAWQAGLDALGSCPESSSRAATVDERLRAKLAAADDGAGGEPTPPPDQEPPPDDSEAGKEAELEKRNAEGRESREDNKDLEDYYGNSGSDYQW